MSQPSTTPVRPTQVTVAAWLIMVGSVFVVLTVWDRIAGLHSIDTRQTLQSVLDDPGVQGTGLTVTDLMAAVKVVSMVAAGCATAMVILGYQALRRSRSARLGLTILAVPLFFSGLVTGGFVSSGVAAAVLTLWVGQARTWFQDSPPAPAPARQQPPPTVSPPPPAGDRPAPPPHPAWPPSPPPPASAPAWPPPPTSAYDARRPVAPPRRPPALLWACVVTWTATAVSAIVLIGSIAVLAADTQTVLDKMHQQNPELARQGVSDHLLLIVGYATCAVLLVWSLAAAVFAILLLRSHRWAWYALTVTAAAAAALCLAGVVASLVFLAPLAATVATIGLLVRPEVRAWLLTR